jgi:hypothetical protein
MSTQRLDRASVAAAIALVAFGGCLPAWAQQNQVPNTLWIGYQLPGNPDREALAREIEAKARTERTGTVAICAHTPNSKQCEREAEITFRGRLLGDRDITFGLYTYYRKEDGSIGNRWLLNLERQSVVNPDLDQNFYHLAPGRIQALGLHVELGGCQLVRDSDDRPINYDGKLLTSTLCELIRRQENATGMLHFLMYEADDLPVVQRVAFLLDHGADVNGTYLFADFGASRLLRDQKPTTQGPSERRASVGFRQSPVLIIATGRGKDDVAQLLLDHGADVNARDDEGLTALMAAAVAERGSAANMVQLLLDHGADVNKLDDNGDTALMEAASTGNVAAVKLLLDHNATVNIADKKGRTAFKIAKKMGHTGIAILLRQHGAKETL